MTRITARHGARLAERVAVRIDRGGGGRLTRAALKRLRREWEAFERRCDHQPSLHTRLNRVLADWARALMRAEAVLP